MTSSKVEKYTGVSIGLHWLLAIALIVQIGLGLWMGDIPKGQPERAYYFNLHKSVGMVLFALVVIRVWWRAGHPAPALPAAMVGWQRSAATASHHLLYLCMFVMPLSGFIGSNFTKYGVKFFGTQVGPWGWEDKGIYAVLNGIHEWCGTLFMIIIGVHVLAAVKHLVVDRDQVFERMLP